MNITTWQEYAADETRWATCAFCDAQIMPTRDDHGRPAWAARFGTTECPERDGLLEGPFRGQVPDSMPHLP